MPKLSRAHLVFGVIQLLAAQVLGCKSDPDTHDVDSGVLPTAGSGGSSAGSGGASAGSSGTSAGSSGTSGASAGSGGSSGTNAGAGSSGTSADPDAGPQTDGAVEPGLDAGPPGTYPTDRASFGLGAASQCGSAASAGLLLCDGFEGAQIDQATWQLDTWGKGSATIDTTRAARGAHSVHITQPAEVSRVMLRETKTFATTGNHFYGRFFMYMPYTTDPLSCPNGNCTNLVHWTAAAAGGTYKEGGKDYQPDVRAIGAVNQALLVNLDGAPVHEVGIDDSNAPDGYKGVDSSHINQWMCFEFEYSGIADSAEIRVWWDGLEHEGLHYTKDHRGTHDNNVPNDLWDIPTYDHLDFGFTHYQDYGSFVQGFDAWLDEIAVDDERIGCGR